MNGERGTFSFHLPEALIAQVPAEHRTASRLMLVARGRGATGEACFADLPDLLEPGDLLVVNDSRVLPARLHLRRSPEGGRVELLLVRPRSQGDWLAMARPMRRLRPGSVLTAPNGDEITVTEVTGDGYVAVESTSVPMAVLASRHGETPLPPYIRRDPASDGAGGITAMDRVRYQTVYARDEGSVAAPTAGLHFDGHLLEALARRGVDLARVTLHVGPGTFRPPGEDDVRERRLHAESFVYEDGTDAALAAVRARGGRVIAVGTTALRVLETVRRLALHEQRESRVVWRATEESRPEFEGEAVRTDAGWRVEGLTRLFVMPPDTIGSADGLITNFHLPGSSLLMLIAAFTGNGVWADVYARAVEHEYRFYSYGDAMLVLPERGKAEETDG